MNFPIEPELPALCHVMEYLMHNPHEPIMYSMKNIFKKNESSLQCFFKSGKADINQTQQYSNFLHKYFDADNARDLTDIILVTYTSHLFNGTIVNRCSNKQTKTLRISSNAEERSMYTDVVDKNWIIMFCRSIGYPIGDVSKLYEDNQATTKQVLDNKITPQVSCTFETLRNFRKGKIHVFRPTRSSVFSRYWAMVNSQGVILRRNRSLVSHVRQMEVPLC